MPGSEVALDTNQAIDVLNDAGNAGTWVQTFTKVFVPAPVVGELRYGALNSGKPAANSQKLEAFLGGCVVLNVTDSTTKHYAGIRLALRKKGTPIPENDVWIAALAVEHDLPLATSDGHFGLVDVLTVIRRP